MRTEKIILQPYDNIDSLLDKLDQVFQVTRGLTQIQVFWPRRGHVLEDSLEYGMVAGWARRNRIQLVFVSTDPQVMMKGYEHQIPVIEKAEDLATKPIRNPDRFQMKRSDSVRMIRLAKLRTDAGKLKNKKKTTALEIPLFLIACLAIAWIVITVIPHAQVSVEPVRTTREVMLPLWTNDTLDMLTLNGGVPSEILRFTVESSETVPATGTILGAGTLATGYLTLRNICDQKQMIPAGTNFSAADDQPWLFHNRADIELPAQMETEIPIEANSSGKDFNIPAGTLRAIEVPYDRCIELEQTKPAAGGDDGIFITPTETDYTLASERITEKLSALSASLVQEKAGTMRIPLMQTFATGKIVSESMQPEIGYAGDSLLLTQTVEVSVRTVNRRDIAQQVQMLLDANPKSGFTPLTDSIQFTMDENQKLAGTGQYGWDVYATQSGEQTLDQEEIKNLISGKTIPDAKNVIRSQYALDVAPEIEVWPSWTDRLPLSSSNIWFKAK